MAKTKLSVMTVWLSTMMIIPCFSEDVDSVKLELGRQLMETYRSREKISDSFKKFLDGWLAETFKMNPQLTGVERVEIRDRVNDIVFSSQERKGGVFDQMAAVYGKYLTAEELIEVIRFTKTDAGKKYADLMPVLLGEGEKIARSWGAEMETGFNQMLAEKFPKKKIKVPPWKK